MKNDRILRAAVSFLFVFCLLAGELRPFPAVQTASAVTQADIDKLKKKGDALSKEKADISKKLSSLSSNKKNTIKRKELLDSQISLLSDEIANANEQIAQYQVLIDQTQGELVSTQKQELEQYALFCKRVRGMEERGNVSYWSVLFRSSDFSTLLSALDFVSEVMESDQRVIDDLRVLRGEITEKQDSLESALAAQEAEKTALDEHEKELKQQRKEASALILKLEENEDEYKDVLDEIEAQEERTQKEIVRLSRELAAQQKTVTTTGGYDWPVLSSRYVTSPFGPRNTGIKGASRNHKGIDIGRVYYSSAVYAAKAGTVIISGVNSSRGSYVVVSHGSGNTTTYQHLSKRLVSVGAVVKKGQQIGVTGSTGVSSGPHLHFEITENGVQIDPLKYLKDYEKGW